MSKPEHGFTLPSAIAIGMLIVLLAHALAIQRRLDRIEKFLAPATEAKP